MQKVQWRDANKMNRLMKILTEADVSRQNSGNSKSHYLKLLEKLSDNDSQNFCFDGAKIVWNSYLDNYYSFAMQQRLFELKEGIATQLLRRYNA